MKRILLFSLALIIISCKPKHEENCDYPFELEEKAEEEKQQIADYSFFRFALQKRMDIHHYPFGWWNSANKVKDSELFIDSLFYNIDSTKVFGLVTVKSKTNHTESDNVICHKHKFDYDGRSFAGYRENNSKNWKLFTVEDYIPLGWSSFGRIKTKMHSYFLSDSSYSFKNSTVSHLLKPDTLNCMGDWENVKIGYSVNESEFWIKSNFWKKGLVIDGYYGFEIRGGSHEYCREPFHEQYKVDFPDSIINKMFQ